MAMQIPAGEPRQNGAKTLRLLVLSDIHYASPAEQARRGYESRAVPQLWLRTLVKGFRHFIWLREPTGQNHLLDSVVNHEQSVDCVVANGDFSCDSGFVGLSDEAAYQSAQLCLDRLRERFGGRFHATIGDHELGKKSLFGGQGGMRLASWHRSLALGLQPFWCWQWESYVLLGVTSSLIALPMFEPEIVREEWDLWLALRRQHMSAVGQALAEIPAGHRVILFCHDPSALPYLTEDPAIRPHLHKIAQTFIGHLHSNSVLRQSRILAGMPSIGFMGGSVRRITSALARARAWQSFNVVLCPSLAGIELLKDGGFYVVTLGTGASGAGGGIQRQFFRVKR